MRPARIFISSVIHDLEVQRTLARSVVSDVGWDPVMMEHGELGIGRTEMLQRSPQKSCLLAVQRSDLVIGLLAGRFNLKEEVSPDELDATYMSFKVDYLLGPEWKYRTTKHLWNGDPHTEHVIVKSSPPDNSI